MLLPDFPASKTGSTTWLFTEEERQIAKERMERDQVSNQESDHSIWYGLKMAAKDFRVWVFVSTGAPSKVTRLSKTVSIGFCSLQ